MAFVENIQANDDEFICVESRLNGIAAFQKVYVEKYFETH